MTRLRWYHFFWFHKILYLRGIDRTILILERLGDLTRLFMLESTKIVVATTTPANYAKL